MLRSLSAIFKVARINEIFRFESQNQSYLYILLMTCIRRINFINCSMYCNHGCVIVLLFTYAINIFYHDEAI